VGAIVHLATAAPEVSGPVNLAGPEPVVADRITKHVAEVLHRPYLFRIPEFALRLALRDAADDMLLSSQRMVPTKLLESGYTFRYTQAADAIDAVF
jgi:NAD dependent epimerase/dehydratase family enzyme